MNKNLFFAASFALCILFTNNLFAQKCTDDYSIVATFDGPTLSHITSDGLGSYASSNLKGKNTEVMFQVCNGSYDFTINLSSSSRYINVNLEGNIVRSTFMNFDRIASVPVTNSGNPAFVNFCGSNPDGTIKLNTPNPGNDNYAGCGSDADGFFVRRNVGIQLTSGRSLRYQNSPLDGVSTLAAGTSYIKVYHPTPTSWVLASEQTPASPTACGAKTFCGAQIYQPNGGVAPSVEGYRTEKFILRVTSSRNY
jgi:hypothetical protein